MFQEWHRTTWFERKKLGVDWGSARIGKGWLTLAVYVVVIFIGRFFHVHAAPSLYYAAVGVPRSLC